MALRRYAQRLLNPFRGAMNIIEQDGAEAVTVDGRHWDIYVRDLALVADLEAGARVQTSEIRYGSWSEKAGLKRGAIHPSDDFKVLEQRGARLYNYLLAHHQEAPFPFADRFELWLLDTEGRPLGLLNSSIDAANIEPDCAIAWRPGLDCEQHFRPASHTAQEPAPARLARIVNERTGATPQAQWFERRPDGGGRGMAGVNLEPALADRRLPADAFPAWFVLNPDIEDENRLLQEFFDWQAPWLLLLQNLAPSDRKHLESLAARRAMAVEKNHRLYPEILDPDTIRAARVEAALRGNAGEDSEEDTMATFYIELNISRTN
jgi:hypothetical protein